MVQKINRSVLIVGAGPAGLMAAIAASGQGAEVTVLDQMPQSGMKLLVTGGGRCNITNNLDMAAFLDRFGKKRRFMQPALHALDRDRFLRFFSDIGIPTHSADGFHIFPQTESAKDVRDALVRVAQRQGVEIKADAKVTDLWIEGGALRGVHLESVSIGGSSVILATGGRSYAQLGSTGSGYRLARQAGHHIVEPLPALVPLITEETWPFRCTGIVISPARVWIDLPGFTKNFYAGDLLFTHRGISGPVALDISGEVAALLQQQDKVPLRLGLLQDMQTEEQWLRVFDEWQKNSGGKMVHNLLRQYFPDILAKSVCESAGCAESMKVAQMTKMQRQALAHHMAGVPVTITGTEGFGKAMVTRGGVSLREVNSKALESRLLHQLFFAGEVLDIDGPCGGYNLQWAFSSGWLAGRSAASVQP